MKGEQIEFDATGTLTAKAVQCPCGYCSDFKVQIELADGQRRGGMIVTDDAAADLIRQLHGAIVECNRLREEKRQ